MTTRLRAATQAGGRPDGWPGDEWSLVVWAAIGAGGWPDATPEADIARQRAQGGDPEVALLALDATLSGQPAEVILVAAWAGLARHATRRRDEAIRRVPEAISARQIAPRAGLSHTRVGAIRRGEGRSRAALVREDDRGRDNAEDA